MNYIDRKFAALARTCLVVACHDLYRHHV